MYLAYKYAKKKRNERNQAKAAELSQLPTTQGEQSTFPPDQVASHNGASNAAVIAAVQPTSGAEKVPKKPEPTPEEKKRKRNYRVKIILSLAAPFMLQALDTTIIASALPFIAQDFNQINQLNWIISAFNLTSAAFLPFWAQLADTFGRFTTILSSIIVVAVGSAICTGSPTSKYSILLLGRAIQGIGVAGISICVRTILADRVSLDEYAFNWTLFSVVSAIGFSIGPVIGGYMTQASWRWCFAINLPVALVALIMVTLFLRKDLVGPQPLPQAEGRDMSTRSKRFTIRLLTIDYGGQLLFLWGLGLLILAFTWAGGSYSWDSAHVIPPLVIGAVLTIAWVLYEYSMSPHHLMSRVFPLQRAMIPWELITQRDIILLFIVNFASGMAMYAIMYFLDLYFTLVKGQSASQGGINLLYFLPGLGVGAYSAMFGTNVWPRQTHPLLLFGSLTSAVGTTVLIWALNAERTPVIYGMMALTGFGVGMRMIPGSLHGIGFFPELTAAITFLVSFSLPFGGTISLTLMTTVFNNKSGADHADPKHGIKYAFIALIPFMWVTVILSTFLGNVWITKGGGYEVASGSYFWSFFTRKQLVREQRIRGEEGLGNSLAPEQAVKEEREEHKHDEISAV